MSLHPRLLLKRLMARFRCLPNYCKQCGRATEAFHVRNAVYVWIVPDGRERCFACFHRAAQRRGLSPTWFIKPDGLTAAAIEGELASRV